MPLPIRAALGLFRLGKRLDVNAVWMPPPDLKQVVFGDRLFSIADENVFAMGKLEIVRRRVAQFKKSRNNVRIQRILLG